MLVAAAPFNVGKESWVWTSFGDQKFLASTLLPTLKGAAAASTQSSQGSNVAAFLNNIDWGGSHLHLCWKFESLPCVFSSMIMPCFLILCARSHDHTNTDFQMSMHTSSQLVVGKMRAFVKLILSRLARNYFACLTYLGSGPPRIPEC